MNSNGQSNKDINNDIISTCCTLNEESLSSEWGFSYEEIEKIKALSPNEWSKKGYTLTNNYLNSLLPLINHIDTQDRGKYWRIQGNIPLEKLEGIKFTLGPADIEIRGNILIIWDLSVTKI